MDRLQTINNQLTSQNDSHILVQELSNKKVLIQLNNKRRNNAINTQMSSRLKDIVQNPNYKIIIIKSTLPQAFGCGGDVKDLYQYLNLNKQNNQSLYNYFFTEFDNNYNWYLFNHMKINNQCGSIAIYQGYTIGEALLFSCYSKIKICTQSTVIMMPECKNGLAIYTPQYFYNLPNNVGVYLWMTGEQVKGYDCVRYGLADYYIDDNDIEQLSQELYQAIDLDQCRDIIEKYANLNNNRINIDNDKDNNKLKYIEQLFKLIDFEQFYNNIIYNSQQINDLELQQFSQSFLEQINKSSRISIRFNYFLLQKCQEIELYNDEFNLIEFNKLQIKSAINMTQLYNDCKEGLKKAVIQKDYQPQWKHKNMLDVTQNELNHILENDEFIQNYQLRINNFLLISQSIMNKKEEIISQQQQQYLNDQSQNIQV